MCGRYALIPSQSAWEQAGQDLGAEMDAILLELRSQSPRYNVSPSQTMPIVVEDPDTQRLTIYPARWGMIPSWWKQDKPPTSTHNARIEGITSKPMWRSVWRNQRCLIPVSLWYEWQNIGGEKLPWALKQQDDSEMMFAGLYDIWADPSSGEQIISFAIVTQVAVDDIADIHNRMPLILAPQVWASWINRNLRELRNIDAELARNQLTELKAYRVKRFVSNSRNEGAGCVEPEQND
ncbi:MAG: SOS response-associated peptidase [Oceanococcus sp.]